MSQNFILVVIYDKLGLPSNLCQFVKITVFYLKVCTRINIKYNQMKNKSKMIKTPKVDIFKCLCLCRDKVLKFKDEEKLEWMLSKQKVNKKFTSTFRIDQES